MWGKMAGGDPGAVLEGCLKTINANTARPDNFLRCVFFNHKHLLKRMFRMLQCFGISVFGLESGNPNDSKSCSYVVVQTSSKF